VAGAPGWNLHPAYYSTIQFPDLNDDDVADVCGRYIYGIICAINNWTSFDPVTYWTSDFSNFSSNGTWSSPAYYSTLQFPNLNEDGRADVCGHGDAGIYCAINNGPSFGTATLWTRRDNQFSDMHGWNSQPSWAGEMMFSL
jgi:hypothetical protein